MDHQPHDSHYLDNIKSELSAQPFIKAVEASDMPFAIADPFAADTPLVFVNTAFLRLTGYDESEVIGRNCRFLQGKQTTAGHRELIGKALAGRTIISQEVLNYRKDGSAFWNELHIAPMHDAEGQLRYFVATQVDVTDRVIGKAALGSELAAKTDESARQAEQALHLAQEMSHRVRNSLSLIQAMLRMQLSGLGGMSAHDALLGVMGRIGAVVEIQRVLEQADANAAVQLDEVLIAICNQLNKIGSVSVTAAIAPMAVPSALLTPLALVTSELVANAQKHAFGPALSGSIAVTANATEPGKLRLSVRDTGHGVAADFDPRQSLGFGMKMVVRQIDQLGATLEVIRHQEGTEFVISVPDVQLLDSAS